MRSRTKLPIVALIYDFDGTLAAGNMQEYSFIDSVGEKKEDFWGQTSVMAEAQDSDNVLVYMLLMLEKAKERAKQIDGKPSVLSFDVHPDKLVWGVDVPLISNCKTRKDIII